MPGMLLGGSPPRQVDANLPDPPSEARHHRDPIRAETRERLSSCGCEELGRTILDEFQMIGRHVGRPLTGFIMRTAPRSDSLSNQIESSRVASKFSNILLGCTAAHCTGRGQTSGVSAFPHPSLSLEKVEDGCVALGFAFATSPLASLAARDTVDGACGVHKRVGLLCSRRRRCRW